MDVILGTAGHIDHGKTTLVRALTGINCDRLEEEQRRGITIESGFAWMDLPDGRRMGIVDVPGHERFIKNMVAGASGMDFVMLVIAADEGVMPQTREHLEICSLLGVRKGLVALTKIDMVDADWQKVVVEDIENTLSGTFLEGAPIIPVSSTSGQGLDRLKEEIIRLVSLMRPEEKTDILRLPVDRVFTMKGFGTVVTGTLVSGNCIQGEKLCVMPSGKLTRARNLQVHNVPAEEARKGQRCAMNLQGLEIADVQRGDIIARPDTLFPSRNWYIRLSCLKSAPLPIRQRMEVHFHHGSKECIATIHLKDREVLEPGQSALAEMKFDRPMAAIYGDHCVIRAHSPLRAIGGGVVVCPLPPVLKKRDRDFTRKLELLQALAETDQDNPNELARKKPEELTALALALCPPPGPDQNRLQVLTGLSRTDLEKALNDLSGSGAAFCWDKGNGRWISEEALNDCIERCRLRALDLHAREPLKTWFAQNALAEDWGNGLPEKFSQEVLNLALQKGILAPEGPGLKLAAHKTRLDAESARILAILRKKIDSENAAPPFIKEIIEEKGLDIKKTQPVLALLCDTGELLKIQEGVYYNKESFEKIIAKIKTWFESNAELDVGNLKEILGISRKYAIPILEYLDAIRLTYRVDNKRRLRKQQG